MSALIDELIPYYQTGAICITPENKDGAVPRVGDYILSFYAYHKDRNGKPLTRPAIYTAQQLGLLHPRSSIEITFVEIDYSQWCIIADWVNNSYRKSITNSSQLRGFASKLTYHRKAFTKRVNGRDFLAIISSPYRAPADLKHHIETMWGATMPTAVLETVFRKSADNYVVRLPD